MTEYRQSSYILDIQRAHTKWESGWPTTLRWDEHIQPQMRYCHYTHGVVCESSHKNEDDAAYGEQNKTATDSLSCTL